MTLSQGKSISQLGTAETYMGSDDLVLISQKLDTGKYSSKAVEKEALEKLTVPGDRDSTLRDGSSEKKISFVDATDRH